VTINARLLAALTVRLRELKITFPVTFFGSSLLFYVPSDNLVIVEHLKPFGAGVMLGTALCHVLPDAREALEGNDEVHEALKLGEFPLSAAILMLGGLLMIVIDHSMSAEAAGHKSFPHSEAELGKLVEMGNHKGYTEIGTNKDKKIDSDEVRAGEASEAVRTKTRSELRKR